MDKILGANAWDGGGSGESCSWSMTPGQIKGSMEGVQEYVKAVKGEDIKMAVRKKTTKDSKADLARSSSK